MTIYSEKESLKNEVNIRSFLGDCCRGMGMMSPFVGVFGSLHSV